MMQIKSSLTTSTTVKGAFFFLNSDCYVVQRQIRHEMLLLTRKHFTFYQTKKKLQKLQNAVSIAKLHLTFKIVSVHLLLNVIHSGFYLYIKHKQLQTRAVCQPLSVLCASIQSINLNLFFSKIIQCHPAMQRKDKF